MNKRDLLEVAVKVMGLYCLLSFFGSIIALGAGLSSTDSRYIENKTIFVTFLCLATALYLAFAMIFVRWGRSIAERLIQNSDMDLPMERPATPPHAHLYFWIRILGLYFFVSLVGHFVSDLAQAGVSARSVFWWSRLLGEILQITLSLVFIFKSQCVAKFVEGSAETVTSAHVS